MVVAVAVDVIVLHTRSSHYLALPNSVCVCVATTNVPSMLRVVFVVLPQLVKLIPGLSRILQGFLQ